MSQKIYSLKLNNSDEVRYIGQTNVSLCRRLNGHKSETAYKTKYNKPLNHKDNWINKYKDIIEIILIEEFEGSQKELDEKEINYIKLFKSFGARLLNFRDGGEGKLSQPSKLKGRKMSLESRIKMSKAQVGKKQTEETKLKRRLAHLGRKNTQETKDLIRSLMKPEHLRKLSNKVGQYDLEGNLLGIFKSVSEAHRVTGFSRSSINSIIKGEYKNPKRFIWKYVDTKIRLNLNNKRK